MVFNKEIARFAFGVIGNIISLILFLSPLPTFVRIRKKKSVERFSAVPYLATFINCGLWVLYGIPLVHPHSILVVTTNGTGFAIEGVYLTLFLLYSDRKKRTKIFLIIVGEIIFLASLAILVLTLVQTHAKRSAIVGSICIAGNILMYASPLAIMAPNSMGIALGLAQLLLYAMYYKSTKRQNAGRKAEEELDLTEQTGSSVTRKTSNSAGV
ncbi:bidirectional sugar transporter SWEET4-like isoform X2 [Nicotiana tabacum]|uniref:Bidirectional sugar transporter SWEET4-like isoform X2 n=1 Tax=Nicotiana tabacum TaxID=4097 RepID=A0A1S3ZMC8_TOBAC|nr:PREDICTED: bidirectional sugar transporter SWEET4-like isoform X2 [Nicotiana tabacum]